MTNTIRCIYNIPLKHLSVFCLLIAVQAAQPVRASTQVDARLDTTGARIGDRLTLTLTAHSAAGESVHFPELESHLDNFEILAELPSETVREEDGAALVRRSFVLTSFETGVLEIPALPFVVMDSAGVTDTVRTTAMKVNFLSLVQDTLNAEIRPIRGLVEVPRLWKKIALWSLAGLAVLVLLIMLWRRYLARRAGRLRLPESGPPARPAHLVALEELDRIKGMGLIEKGEIKLFHILISETMRRYLDGRYGIDAPEMTTWELCAGMDLRRDIDSALKELVREFMESCDLVKFAKYKPAVVEINSTFNRAYEIIEKSRPVERLSQLENADGEDAETAVVAGRPEGGDAE